MKDTEKDDNAPVVRDSEGYYTAHALCYNCYWTGMVVQEKGVPLARDMECPHCGVENIGARHPSFKDPRVMMRVGSNSTIKTRTIPGW